jgi:hypothetical protein
MECCGVPQNGGAGFKSGFVELFFGWFYHGAYRVMLSTDMGLSCLIRVQRVKGCINSCHPVSVVSVAIV